MAYVTNEVRVFISSTFRDFQLERRIIHEQVSPPLQEICKHYGLRLFLSDLRWGVTEHDVREHLTSRLCLDEVENCVVSSPELNFLCLLGERYGSRVLPRELDLHGLVRLLGALEASGAGLVARAVRSLYDIETTGQIARRYSETEATAESFLSDRTALGILRTLDVADPAGQATCEALTCSLTHREILRSGALSVESSRGAIAILRDHVIVTRGEDEQSLAEASWSPEFVDDGELATAQLSLRRQVENALVTRVARVGIPVTDAGSVAREYASIFRKAVTGLLRDGVERAKGRGTRVHRFVALGSQMALRPDPPLHATAEQSEVEGWLSEPSQSARLAIVGDPSTFRASLLLGLYNNARQEKTWSVVYLDLIRRPELSEFRHFVITVLACLSPDALDEATIERLLNTRVRDLNVSWTTEIAHAAHHRPVLLLIDGLDGIRTNPGDVLPSFWKSTPNLAIAFTCMSDFEPLHIHPETIRVIRSESFTKDERSAVITTELAGAGHLVSDGDLEALVVASESLPSPGYASTLAQAYIISDGDPQAGWKLGDSDRFYDAWPSYLIRTAPFPEVVCKAFLGLMTTSDLGITEIDFLNISAAWDSVRRAIAAAFPLGLPSQRTPPLVWHRLRAHFSSVITELGISDEVSFKASARVVTAIGRLISAETLQAANDHFREVLWSQRADPTARVAVELPRLLVKSGDTGRLTGLLLTKSFVKSAIGFDRGHALVGALNSCANREPLLTEVRKAIEGDDQSSIQALSHWLLDLNIILRQLGHPTEASDAARRAYKLRRKVLPASHRLTIAAALEATDSYMEGGAFAEALELGQEVLGAISEDTTAEVRTREPAMINRLRGNLAAAHDYKGDFDEAIRLYHQYLAASEPEADADLFSGHNGLTVAYTKKREFARALEYSAHALSSALVAFGETSESYGLALVNRGGLLLETGAYADATVAFRRALSIYADAFDPGHPWRQNAAKGLFMGLAESDRLHEAMMFLTQEIRGVTAVYDGLLWGDTVAKHILAALPSGEPAVTDVFAALDGLLTRTATASRDQSSRGFQKVASLLLGGIDDEQGRAGVLITSIALWTLAAVAAVRCSAISKEAGCSLLRQLEKCVKDRLGGGATLLERVEKFRDCWAYFVSTYPHIQADFQLYRELLVEAGLVPDLAMLVGRVEASDEELENSIIRLELRLKEAENRRPPDDEEIGQIKILLASKYSAVRRHQDAQQMQSDVTNFSRKRFGRRSREHAVALMNLGSVQFAGEQWNLAFRSYCEGFITILRLPKLEPFETFGGAFQKTLEAGTKFTEFRRVAKLVDLIASRYGHGGLGINLSLFSAGAWLETDEQMRAVTRFERAVDEFTKIDGDARPWLKPISVLAFNLAKRVYDVTARRHFAVVVERLEREARARDLSSELENLDGWPDVIGGHGSIMSPRR